jgi:hypothetical protein
MTTKKSSANQRRARLSAALRENLRRRKAQARGRAALKATAPDATMHNAKDARTRP